MVADTGTDEFTSSRLLKWLPVIGISTPSRVDYRHFKGANFLFLDNHSEWFKIWEISESSQSWE
jgi:prepilin-type processing-associated H-X9-DG protein